MKHPAILFFKILSISICVTLEWHALGQTPPSAKIVEEIFSLPVKKDQVGFAERATLDTFLKFIRSEPDNAQKSIILSNLGFADLNLDSCITSKEYQLFLEAHKMWNRTSRKIQREQMLAFFKTEHIVSGHTKEELDLLFSFVRDRAAVTLSNEALYVLWNSVINGRWAGDDNKWNKQEVETLEARWNEFLKIPASEVTLYIEKAVSGFETCSPLSGPVASNAPLKPLDHAIEIAGLIERNVHEITDTGQFLGKAGVAAFFGSLYGRTRKQEHLDRALKLFKEVEKEYDTKKSDMSLVEGSAGIAFSALAAYQNSQVPYFLDVAVQFAEKTKLNTYYEYAYGAAGIGLLKLNLYTITRNEKWLLEAQEAGDFLVKKAVLEGDQAWWVEGDDFPAIFSGFGHGSAGIGYFFIHLYQATRNTLYRTYAEKAAEHVIQTAYHDADGNMHWTWYQPPVGYGSTWKYQWTHGNFGIAYLFDSLNVITPQKKWSLFLRQTLVPAMQEGDEFGFDEGGQCCGKSSQGDLYIELYRHTKNPDYLKLARKAAAFLLNENGRVKEDRLRTKEKYDASYSGLAGIGLFFLRLDRPLKMDLPYQIYSR